MKTIPAHDLDQRIAAHVRTWSVQVDHTTETETAVLLFGHSRGRSVVLKVIREPGSEWRSGEILAAFEGRGSVRAYEHSEGALLLERLSPGTPLLQLTLAGQDEDAIGILASAVAAMSPCPAPFSTPSALDWGRGFTHYAERGDWRIPANLVAEAHELYVELCLSQSPTRLLHGDLHHHNVLFDAKRGWLAIDPKGVVGEPEFEIGAILRNPFGRPDLFAHRHIIERRLGRLAAKLPIDPSRALSWAFAQAVLSAVWSIEDGFFQGSSHPGLLLAEEIRPMLRLLG